MSQQQVKRERLRAQREEREREAAASERRRTRLLQLGGVAAAAAVVVAVLVLVSQSGGKHASTKPPAKGGAAAHSADVNGLLGGIPQQGSVLGNPSAKLTLIEFADLQCPFCQQASTQVIPTLVQRYVRTGKIKLQLRLTTAIGPDSVPAAEFAYAAGAQNRMWQFAELFYRNQGEENSGYVTSAFLRTIASGVRGLNVAAAANAAGGVTAQRLVNETQAEANRLAVPGTPTFYLQRGGGPPQQLSQLSATDLSSVLDSALRGG